MLNQLTQPEICTLLDSLATTMECVQGEIADETDEDERERMNAHREELEGIVEKLEAMRAELESK